MGSSEGNHVFRRNDGAKASSCRYPRSRQRQRVDSLAAFHFAAGLSTGLLSAAILQPVDLLKTRVQQSRSATLRGVVKDIVAGPRALQQLWRGTLPSVIRTGVGSALYFTALNALRQQIARRTATVTAHGAAQSASSSVLPRLSGPADLLTGAAARVAAGLVLMPVTVLKVRYESSLYAYPSLGAATRSLVRTDGVRGLFAGFGATAARDAPYAGLFVLCYERLKSALGVIARSPGDGSAPRPGPAAAVHLAASVGAAGLATALTNPFDAVKTRVQLQPREYRNLAAAGARMLREEGARSFFDGLGLRVARKAASSALAWTLYEDLIRRAERSVAPGREI